MGEKATSGKRTGIGAEKLSGPSQAREQEGRRKREGEREVEQGKKKIFCKGRPAAARFSRRKNTITREGGKDWGGRRRIESAF